MPSKSSNVNAVEHLSVLVKEDMAKVNQQIIAQLQAQTSAVSEIASYLVTAGGKRLRPMLTLAAARLCEYEGTHHILLAASLELMHTATLLHDDVVDKGILRRAQKAAHTIWGNKTSILVGDFLLGRAFRMMVDSQSLPALHVLSSTASIIAEGEVWHMTKSSQVTQSQEECLAIIKAKTSALFQAAAQVGGIIAQSPQKQIKALCAYGYNLGMTFQISDDICDYNTTDENKKVLQKEYGNDFREGKVTLPVILAYRESNVKEKKFWQEVFSNKQRSDDDFIQALKILQKYGAFDKARKKALAYSLRAKASLEAFSKSPMRHALHDVADYCVQRAF